MSKSETTSIFAERLTDLINDEKISLGKLEEATGISKSALSKYTNNEAEAPITNVVKLAKHFNVSADYLLGISGAPTNDKDLQFICDYTGLSLESVETLNKYCTMIIPTLPGMSKRIFEFKEIFSVLDDIIQNQNVVTGLIDILKMNKQVKKDCREIEKFIALVENVKTRDDYEQVCQEYFEYIEKFGEKANYLEFKISKDFEWVFKRYYYSEYKKRNELSDFCDKKFEKLYEIYEDYTGDENADNNKA